LSLMLQVFVRDGNNLILLNRVENLKFKWTIENQGTMDQNLATIVHTFSNQATVRIMDHAGQFTIKCQIEGYDIPFIEHNLIPSAQISTSELNYLNDKNLHSLVVIQVANELALSPSSFLLFMPVFDNVNSHLLQNRVQLRASGGSGSYIFSHNTSTVADHDLSLVRDSSDVALVTLTARNGVPDRTGTLHVTVSVRDENFLDSIAQSHGIISSIGTIVLRGESQVIEQEQSVIVELHVFDRYNRQEFAPDQVELMKIELSVSRNSIISMERLNTTSWRITGLQRGKVHLTASSKFSDVQSAPFSITVYDRLSITPSRVTVLLGGSAKFDLQGGAPFAQKKVALVNQSGSAKLIPHHGHDNAKGASSARVQCMKAGIVQVVAHTVNNGRNVSAIVECVELAGIELLGGDSLTMFSGNSIHLSPIGLITSSDSSSADSNKMVTIDLSNMQNHALTISYHVSNSSVLQVAQSSNNGGTTATSAMVRALNIGDSTIEVKALINGKTLTTRATVHVHEKLYILDYPSRELIISPNSQIQLHPTPQDALFTFVCTDEQLATVSSSGKLTSKTSVGYGTIKAYTPDNEQVKVQKFSVELPRYIHFDAHKARKSASNSNNNAVMTHVQVQANTITPLAIVAKNKYGEVFANTIGIPIQVNILDEDLIECSTDSGVIHLTALGNAGQTIVQVTSEHAVPFYFVVSVVGAKPYAYQQQQQTQQQQQVQNQVFMQPGDIYQVQDGVSVINIDREDLIHYNDYRNELEVSSAARLSATATSQYGISRVFFDDGSFVNIRVSKIDSIEPRDDRSVIRSDLSLNRIGMKLVDMRGAAIPILSQSTTSVVNGKLHKRHRIRCIGTSSPFFTCEYDEATGMVDIVNTRSMMDHEVPSSVTLTFEVSVLNEPAVAYQVKSVPISVMNPRAPAFTQPSTPSYSGEEEICDTDRSKSSGSTLLFLFTLIIGIVSFVGFNALRQKMQGKRLYARLHHRKVKDEF